MNNVIVFGVSMTAATVLDGIRSSIDNINWNIVGFLDDDPLKHHQSYFGLPVLGSFTDLQSLAAEHQLSHFVLGLADHRHMLIRDRAQRLAAGLGLAPATSIHSRAVLVDSCVVGLGAFIMPNVYIGVNTTIGDHCSIHAGVSVLEACRLGHNVMVAGNTFVGGHVTIGDNVYIGPGATIASGVDVGSNCLVGAGALVLKDIPRFTAAFGHPVSVCRANHYYL